MNVMMELRKCCNHPYLNRGVEGFILSEVRNTTCLSRTDDLIARPLRSRRRARVIPLRGSKWRVCRVRI